MSIVPSCIIVAVLTVALNIVWLKNRQLHRQRGTPLTTLRDLPQGVHLARRHQEDGVHFGQFKGSIYFLRVGETDLYYSVFSRNDLPEDFILEDGKVQKMTLVH